MEENKPNGSGFVKVCSVCDGTGEIFEEATQEYSPESGTYIKDATTRPCPACRGKRSNDDD